MSEEVIHALFQAAKELNAECTGMSWSGFNVVGDRKSIEEVRRLIHQEERFEAYQRRMEQSKA